MTYDIKWIERIFDYFGFKECFEENKLKFLVRSPEITELTAVAMILALKTAKKEKITFTSYEEFINFKLDVFSVLPDDSLSAHKEELKRIDKVLIE